VTTWTACADKDTAGCASTGWCRRLKTFKDSPNTRNTPSKRWWIAWSITDEPAFRKRLTDSVETALKLGQGSLIVHVLDHEDLKMSEARSCCGVAYPELEPTLFSFNAPQGMCPECNGIGTQLTMDVDKLVPDKRLSIRQGAVLPYRNYFIKTNGESNSWGGQLNWPPSSSSWASISTAPGTSFPKSSTISFCTAPCGRENDGAVGFGKDSRPDPNELGGLINTMMRRYLQTQSENQKKYYSSFMSSRPCRSCQGRRLKPEVCHVRIDERSIIDVTAMTIGEVYRFCVGPGLEGSRKLIGEELIKEIANRLRFLLNVGLDYLSLIVPGRRCPAARRNASASLPSWDRN
jgi:excinuclease ABC subunit A